MFILFILFVILLRIAELFHSKNNEKWLNAHGAKEYGQSHYPWIVGLHTLFFISLLIEFYTRSSVTYSLLMLIIYLLLLVIKAWVIFSLGKFWSTKIYHIQDAPLVSKGPYKYLKHPNYLVVLCEIAVIPLTFHLYYTAIVFTVLNAMALYVRIKDENRVLKL